MRIFRVEKENHDGPFIPTTGTQEEKNEFYDALPSAAPWLKVQVIEADAFMQLFYGLPPTATFRRAEPDNLHPHHESDVDATALMRLEFEAGLRETRLRTGVDSMDMLHHWFSPSPEASAFFAKYGYALNTYECDERWVAKGQYQLVFICEEAILIERKPFE